MQSDPTTPKPLVLRRPDPPTAVAPDAQQIFRHLRKYWRTAIGVALAVFVGTTFFTLSRVRVYRAEATIQLDPNPPRPLGKDVEAVVDVGAGNYWDNREYTQTQHRLLQSMSLAIATSRALDLAHDQGFLQMKAPGAPPDPAAPSTVEQAAEVLRSRIAVVPVKDSRLAVVQIEDADPVRAHRVLTALVDTYVERNLETAVNSTSSAVDWLRTQLDTLKTDLDSSEMALHEFKRDKNILSVDIDAQSNMLREEMKQLNDTLTAVRARREEIAARREQLGAIAGEDPSRLPVTELLQSPLLQLFRQRYIEAVRERESLVASGHGEQHPDVLAADAAAVNLKSALLAEVKNVQGAMDRDLGAIQRQEGGLSGLFERAKHQALDLNLLEIEYNRLRRTRDNTERLYRLVLERTKESDLTRMMRVNNVRVVDAALVPRTPVRPKVPLNLAVGTIVGLLLGVLSAMGRALLDRTVKTPDDAERELGLACLGLIPEYADPQAAGGKKGDRRRRRAKVTGSRELAVFESPTSSVAEAARAVRTNLMFMSPDRQFHSLLVTSAAPGEGKTTVACCIAIAIAQAGQRVVLVDCDLRRPRLHRVFSKPIEHGVTTALLGEQPLDYASFRTEIPNLSVIPSGPLPPNPAELVHSAKFKAFVESLLRRYDRVILDSPPIVAVTDATILSTLVDGAILVVRAFQTKKELARFGVRSLSDVGSRPVGVVLNAVDLHQSEYRYEHYYYRRDEYYASNPEDLLASKRAVEGDEDPPPPPAAAPPPPPTA